MNKLSTFALCLGLPMFVAGCGGGVNYQLPQAPPPTGPPPLAQQSGSVAVSPQYAALSPGQSATFAAQGPAGASIEWMVNNVPGGNASVGTIDSRGNYIAPKVPLGTNFVVSAALAGSPQQNYASAVVAVIASGQLTPTPNPQVVAYSIYLPAPGNVRVQFGSSNLRTSSLATPSAYGGMVHVYVAGMYGNTAYHMHALVELANGATLSDIDHVFTTGTPFRASLVQVTTSGSPQPGIELFDTVIPPNPAQLFATDLNGTVIWTYHYQGSQNDAVQAAKPLPNGDFLVLISFVSSIPQSDIAKLPSDTLDVVREVDLAGNTIRELTLDQLKQSLAALGYNFAMQGFHHDVLPLPNGHMILLTNFRVPYQNLPGYPGTTSVLGDLLVDVDQNFRPVWVWNSFDHLDVNRHPMNFPDWTHGNAILYSADDHNLLFSMRHQNWIVKIDYRDGQGTGDILWRLGRGGDFKLVGGTDPTDWFYAQHGPSYFTSNTTGVFQLGVMDNGDDRQFPPGVVCDSSGQPPCHYSTAPVLQIDESTMSATLLSHYTPPTSFYSFFGGNVDLLGDGHIEADLCAVKTGAVVQELNESGGATRVVWQAVTPGDSQYHAYRLPSLYPGVQW